MTSDAAEERDRVRVRTVIGPAAEDRNALDCEDTTIDVQARTWERERDLVRDAGAHPQSTANRRLVDEAAP